LNYISKLLTVEELRARRWQILSNFVEGQIAII
jgi:hypothetical protein